VCEICILRSCLFVAILSLCGCVNRDLPGGLQMNISLGNIRSHVCLILYMVPLSRCSPRSHLVDAFHPALLQVHLGAQEVGVLAVVPGHLEVHVHAVGGPAGGHCK